MSAPKPWLVDAQAVEELNDRLFHRTRWIDSFLDSRNTHRFFIVATKGFGKTLLLKAKRLNEQRSGVTAIPENQLADTVERGPILSASDVEGFLTHAETWRKIWIMAIAMSAIKAAEIDTSRLRLSEDVKEILHDPFLKTPGDFFTNLLHMGRNLFHSFKFLDSSLLPALKSIHSPVFFFIDRVDEIFELHLEAANIEKQSELGYLYPELWHLVQSGLVWAVFHLYKANNHIKVFTSIRKEAFLHALRDSSMQQQVVDMAVEISYSAEDLFEIFMMNLRAESAGNLASPHASDPIARFVGENNLILHHSYTGEAETLFDYVYRHTLLRPRDFMTIGGAISRLGPKGRTQAAIKGAVNDAASTIVETYIQEFAPHVNKLELNKVLMGVTSNVIKREDVIDICRTYNGSACTFECKSCSQTHIFCVLYRAGLIGVLQRDPITNKTVQSFVTPGSFINDSLPNSPFYLIHPVLDTEVRKHNEDYADNIDKVNVVGHGRPWTDPTNGPNVVRHKRCVLKGDIVGYSKIMEDPDVRREVDKAFQKIVEEVASSLELASIEGGDSLTLIDANPMAVVKSVIRIIEELCSLTSNPQIRIAIDYGDLEYVEVAGGTMKLESGAPLRTAARLEPLSQPNKILATAALAEALGKTQCPYKATPLTPGQWPNISKKNGQFNIKKKGSKEPDFLVDLYQIRTAF